MSLYGAALLVLLGGGIAALAASRAPRLALVLGSAGAGLGGALGLAAVVPFLLGAPAASLHLPWAAPVGAFHIRLDALSAFFQAALFALSIPAAIYGAGYMRPFLGRRSLPAFLFFFDLLVASISLVLSAADGVLFLVAWEVMTVATFVLVTFEDEHAEVRSAGLTFLVASHLGTAFLFALFVLLGRRAGGFDFERLEALRATAAAPALLFGLALVGFGTKAGLAPLHVWLPEAHPAAPSHVSALLSGVMIKTGVYGILRTLSFLPPAPVSWGLVLGGVGLASALAAITLALGQRDVKRALAYSSVENVGIVSLGLGTGLAGGAAGMPLVSALGFGGALLHVWNHAAMKGLAFMGAGALAHAAHTRDLERMGGLLARLPVSGAAFVVGTAALAALPPLAGFASEWLLYLGLLAAAASSPGAFPLVADLAVVALALVGALAAVAFTRLAGVALLGTPRSPAAAAAHEPPPAMWAPLVALAVGCLALGLYPAEALRLAAAALAQVGGPGTAAALAPAAAALAVPIRIAALALLGLAVLLFALGDRLRSGRDVRPSETWGCGFARPSPRMEYTGSSYAQLLHGGLVPRSMQPRIRLQPPRGPFPGKASFGTEAQDPARTRIYDPVFRALGDRMSRLRRFQADRLNLQLLYTLVTVVVLAAALALRGWLP